MLCGLIMAGGQGTRFWPASTTDKPKQFLHLIGNQSMLQLTFHRLKKILPIDNIFVITAEQYTPFISEQIPDLPNRNIIIEPVGRNTAPCIALACYYIEKLYANARIAVFPADHNIQNIDVFVHTIQMADKFVEKNQKSIVTIGVTPTYPETDYGYIKYSKAEEEILNVEQFIEKPNAELAKQYMNSGNYLWNAGMFVFSATSMIEQCKQHIPKVYDVLSVLQDIQYCHMQEKINAIYPLCETISIDYAVIEKSKDVYVIPASFGWDDVGNWDAVERYMEKDVQGNIKKGNVSIVNAHHNIIYTTGKKVIFINVDNLYCVETEEHIVIGNKEELNQLHHYRKKL